MLWSVEFLLGWVSLCFSNLHTASWPPGKVSKQAGAELNQVNKYLFGFKWRHILQTFAKWLFVLIEHLNFAQFRVVWSLIEAYQSVFGSGISLDNYECSTDFQLLFSWFYSTIILFMRIHFFFQYNYLIWFGVAISFLVYV